MTSFPESQDKSMDQIITAAEPPQSVYLHPGQIVVAGDARLVTTILGSCVAICLWDPKTMLAGINHYLLPTNPLRGQLDARYGNTAIDLLIDQMVERGAAVSRLAAKIVGGAAVMSAFSGRAKSIGELNVEVAYESLKKFAIPVVAEQVGGQRGRKLLFHTGNGCAYSKEI